VKTHGLKESEDFADTQLVMIAALDAGNGRLGDTHSSCHFGLSELGRAAEPFELSGKRTVRSPL
jgi:hypothetical protein